MSDRDVSKKRFEKGVMADGEVQERRQVEMRDEEVGSAPVPGKGRAHCGEGGE